MSTIKLTIHKKIAAIQPQISNQWLVQFLRS